jgi:hypothetical protein
VPIHALTHTQFIAAGVLFLILFAAGRWFGVTAAAHTDGRGFLLILGSTAVVGLFALTQVSVRAAVAFAGYWFWATFMPWSISASQLSPKAVRKATTEVPRKASWWIAALSPIGHWITLFVVAAALFGAYFFPAIPQWLGGGDGRRVSLFWATPLTEAERKSVGVGDDCVFEVHSDPAYLYLMFLASTDGRCGEPKGWERVYAPIGSALSKRSYMVVKRERIASVVYK